MTTQIKKYTAPSQLISHEWGARSGLIKLGTFVCDSPFGSTTVQMYESDDQDGDRGGYAFQIIDDSRDCSGTTCYIKREAREFDTCTEIHFVGLEGKAMMRALRDALNALDLGDSIEDISIFDQEEQPEYFEYDFQDATINDSIRREYIARDTLEQYLTSAFVR